MLPARYMALREGRDNHKYGTVREYCRYCRGSVHISFVITSADQDDQGTEGDRYLHHNAGDFTIGVMPVDMVWYYEKGLAYYSY